jgi:hypothetical protein
MLNYITELLISPDELQEELMNTSDIFAKITASAATIRRISGLETAPTPQAPTLASSRI